MHGRGRDLGRSLHFGGTQLIAYVGLQVARAHLGLCRRDLDGNVTSRGARSAVFGYADVMAIPIDSTLEPMLARLARQLPADEYLYEPKWDGFRCLAFRDGEDLDLRSRNQRPLARYFPELVEGLLAVPEQRFALDAEILAAR